MQSINPNLAGVVLPTSKSTVPVLVRPGLGRPEPAAGTGTLEERSRWLGRALARRGGGDCAQPLDWILGDGAPPDSFGNVSIGFDGRCRGWIESLISSSMSEFLSLESSPWLCSSKLFALLGWAWKHTEGWDSIVRESCLLKPLVPLYLISAIPADQRGGLQASAAIEVRHLAMELIALIELSRSLGPAGFALWLNQRGVEGEDMRRTIQGGLSVDLSCIAKALAEKRQESNQKLSQDFSHASSISELEHERYWSLAWQWSRAEEALLVPAGVPAVMVPWDDLIAHWKAVYGAFCQNTISMPRCCVEIRTMGDTQLQDRLEHLLDEVRTEQGIATLVMVRYVGEAALHSNGRNTLAWWQTACLDSTRNFIEGTEPIGFVNGEGNLGLVYRDMDRNELAQLVRDALGQMRDAFVLRGLVAGSQSVPLIVGIASVEGPSRSFQMARLLDSAGRCLENAATQGPGTIKSIEVF